MGTLYYALNRESKQAVELGKWGMWDLSPIDPHSDEDDVDAVLKTIKSKADFFRSLDAGKVKFYSDSSQEWKQFYEEMADFFDKTGWPVERVSEHYREGGICDVYVQYSRYSPEQSDVGTRLCTHTDCWCDHN